MISIYNLVFSADDRISRIPGPRCQDRGRGDAKLKMHIYSL